MNRREFLTTSAYIGSALALGATIPLALLGDPAGGFYAAIPDDLSAYLRDHGEREHALADKRLRLYSMMALWAPVGARYGSLAMFAGTTVVDRSDSPNIIAAKVANRSDSMRDVLRRHHEPGWFLVRESETTSERDAEGDPIIRSVEKWKRIGYLKWLTVAEADKLSRGPFIVEAA